MFFREQAKKKAITFSYDDGVTQDIRLIELLNKYGLKCTFNLNSELLSKKACLFDNASVLHTIKYIRKMLSIFMKTRGCCSHSDTPKPYTMR